MSSEMRELIAKWRSEVDGGPDRELKEIGYDACLLDCADELEALLARTEAGADGADMIQWRYTNAETGEVLTPWTECDAAFREKRKDAPGYQFRELFAHPQDASGDAVMREALERIRDYEGDPRTPVRNSVRKSGIARAALNAMQAKEAK